VERKRTIKQKPKPQAKTSSNVRASSPASRKRMQAAGLNRRRSRGTYYKDYILTYVLGVAEKSGCSFSCAVNLLLEKTVSGGLAGEVEEQLGLEVRRQQLLAEEAGLRQILKVLLRSGAYLPQYAQKLFEGRDPKDFAYRKGRLPLPALASAKEQEIVRRILARRERIVMELIEIADKLLPKEQFKVGLEESGWTVRSNRPRGTRTGQSKHETGGENTK
jgi:hypothetical protein